MVVIRYFVPADGSHVERKRREIEKILEKKTGKSSTVETEHCFHIVLKNDCDVTAFESAHLEKLCWLLSNNPFHQGLSKVSLLKGEVREIGPRLTFKTAYCTNALSATAAAGIDDVTRIEKTTRFGGTEAMTSEELLLAAGDRMTEFIYPENIDFTPSYAKEDFFEINILGDPNNLDKANATLGLAFDASDLTYYKDLFINQLKRNPTDVELFDLAQSDSEHSRHWFFRGELVVDGKKRQGSLMHSIRDTQNHSNPNNLIAFCDNSSAIRGFPSVRRLEPSDPSMTSSLSMVDRPRHLIYSAETHNFPTAVCPFQGATTGTGGRIRDIHATGKGAHEIAGVAGYSFGNLHLDDYSMPWEDDETYPEGFSHPRHIAVEASNGASDYGNKFGEPVLTGFARSFGQRLPNGERCEYVKPIMFSGGVGAIDDEHISKDPCASGMLLAKIGGPVYRIGVGGGAASSLSVQGARESSLDFGAVQRGDAEMGQKLHRVVRACCELGTQNPILSIHDQGAGGNGNVLKELVEGCGAVIDAEAFELGDQTISSRELWTAEYQENDACLVDPTRLKKMEAIARREKCTVAVVGTVTDQQRVVLENFKDSPRDRKPVDFDTKLLGERQKKVFQLTSSPMTLRPLEIPAGLTVRQALEMVLRLPSVASKRYLTCKVDRSVTGLVASQQCVGPLHTPLADVAVVALSPFEKARSLDRIHLERNLLVDWPILPPGISLDNLRSLSLSGNLLTSLPPNALSLYPALQHLDLSHNQLSEVGAAVAVGEQPIKGLLNPASGARMSLAETLTNLVFAPISDIRDVKLSGNWMWAAKCEGEGAKLVDACDALCKALSECGCAIDGGKDSLSMAAKAGGQLVKAPGTLVLSAYAPCTDITKVVTPDLKGPKGGSEFSTIIYVRFGSSLNSNRLGGSALAQVLKQIGNESSDIENFANLVAGFEVVQELINEDLVLAGHDVSDGGLITALLEMAFAGNMQLTAAINSEDDCLTVLFSEEAGVLLEVETSAAQSILTRFQSMGVEGYAIGTAHPVYGPDAKVRVSFNGSFVVDESLVVLREVWEETGDRLGKMQTEEKALEEAKQVREQTRQIAYKTTFDWTINSDVIDNDQSRLNRAPKIAIIREEGSNGDREMAAAFVLAGFQTFDVTMTDLLAGHSLDQYRGLAFVGGFSYADVLGSAKGWAAAIRFNPSVAAEFDRFRRRQNTFSFGVCNGCQLMGLLGWIGEYDSSPGVFLAENECGRFDSSFGPVRIENSPSIMMQGMEGAVLGLWSSHGEGRFTYSTPSVQDSIQKKNLIALRYTDGTGQPTEQYPWNPNGSVNGVAGICSEDGRHLAMMPHSDRSFMSWHWPSYPTSFEKSLELPVSPWIKMFQNAYEWTMKH